MWVKPLYRYIHVLFDDTDHIDVRSGKQKVKRTNLKCIDKMQDNMCHPYILSTTILSDLLCATVGAKTTF